MPERVYRNKKNHKVEALTPEIAERFKDLYEEVDPETELPCLTCGDPTLDDDPTPEFFEADTDSDSENEEK